MSTLFNAAEINGSIGASTLVLNDYRLTISDIEGGHRLTVERGGEVQTMDVMDGSATSGTIDHRELTNRDAENQHPMSAIEGLEAALEEKQPKGDYILNTVADLVNYYTKSEVYTQAEVNELVSAIPKFKIEVVQTPQEMYAKKDPTTIYLLANSDSAYNIYSEYIFVNDKPELLGTQTLDLTGYATETWVDEKLTDYQPTGDYATASDLSRLTGAGVVWVQSNIPVPTGQFYGITYTNGIWLAYGYRTGFYYSTDGMTWVEANISNADIDTITYANGVWVASTSAGFCYSTDGITWTQSNIWGLLTRASIYANGIWVAGSNNGFFYSTDGMTWTQSNVTSGQASVFTYANGIWVASGYDTGIYYSTDGMTWTQSNVTSVDFSTIIYNGDIWVAGGEYITSSGLYYSTDGITWTQSNIISGGSHAIIYANGIWVADAYSDSYSHSIYYSIDGMTWTQSNVTSGGSGIITYANGIWVADSNNGFFYSTDGMTWTQSNVTSGQASVFTYANGIWVAGAYSESDSHILYYSTDGMTWVETNVVTSGIFLVITYADGVWVAGGYGTGIYYSPRQMGTVKSVNGMEPNEEGDVVLAYDDLKDILVGRKTVNFLAEWDGNGEGLPSGMVNDEFPIYKVGDDVIPKDQLVGTVIEVVNDNVVMTSVLTEESIESVKEYITDAYAMIEGLLFVYDYTNEAAQSYGVTSNGTWLCDFSSNNNGKPLYFRKITHSWTEIVQLDEKYIPESIARKSDIPEIPSLEPYALKTDLENVKPSAEAVNPLTKALFNDYTLLYKYARTGSLGEKEEFNDAALSESIQNFTMLYVIVTSNQFILGSTYIPVSMFGITLPDVSDRSYFELNFINDQQNLFGGNVRYASDTTISGKIVGNTKALLVYGIGRVAS